MYIKWTQCPYLPFIHIHGHSPGKVRTHMGGAEDLPEIPLVCHIFTRSPASFGMFNSVAFILSNLWLAVYSRHDLIPQKNIPSPKTHIFLFIFISSCLFSLHCSYYVVCPTHRAPCIRDCQEKGHWNERVKPRLLSPFRLKPTS